MATETTTQHASDSQMQKVASFDGDEKADVTFVEDIPTYDTLQTKRLLRKIDWHLIPFLSLLYLLSFLDRTNIGNAKLFGLEKAIGLEGMEYNTALSVFFVTYVLFEVPSNMVLKRWRASMWFPIMMLAWGITMTLTGLVKDFKGLVIARVFLGVAEAGLFPGVNYYITLWYCRRECAFRAAIFFSAATVAGAFGGLLARGINEMDGLGGKDGWAWIFILEGLLTVIVAIIAFWAMADSPATASFLNAEEAKEVSLRLSHDNDDLASHYDAKFMKAAFVDWKIWVQSVAYIGILVPLYSFSLFLPSIIRAMGYSDAMSQLLTVPPYVVGCIFTVLGGFYSDRMNKRAVFLGGYCISAIIGYVFLLSTDTPAVQYIGTFLAACGVYPMIPIMVMWNGNNIGGSTKRGAGIAIQIAFGNCGGVISSFIYRNGDRPRYFLGHGVCLGFLCMSFVLIVFQWFALGRINKRRDEEHPHPNDYSTEMKRLEMDSGDEASFFRYTR
ncbi:related to allantoate permease [Rhynchosporium agropyri]|uniref:Related to allantoate permease n=1 Tax=Rhynchosporium agropyri TaxID=914238 RepID=A0A1E1L4E7_9HELO|nr:related to allantoate permease [Rhynchosporium agropyri]